MTPPRCVICDSDGITGIASAVGERWVCRTCFHSWRRDVPAYAYDSVAMCGMGTTPQRLQSQIDFFAPAAPARAGILEIGCATGELASAVKAALDVDRYEAIELSPAAEQAEARVDKLYREPLQRLVDTNAFGEQRFDLVLISHVLEHLPSPALEVAAMEQLLAKDGAIFIEVPNRSGNQALEIDDNRAHLHFFSPLSLLRLLAGAGLEPTAVSTKGYLDPRYSDSLRVLARRFRTPAWSRRLLSDHPALATADKVIVWGAGSLAEEILANFFDPERIDFFIDKDPSKQGSTCLGRPVRAPSALGTAPRTVLVNSIDFAPAIEADIERLYPQAHRTIRIGDLLARR